MANASVIRKLDFSKLSNRKSGFLTTSEAIKDITPIKWSDDIINGKKEVIISKEGIKEV